MNFGNIQKFPVVLKLWLKIESFDHSGPAKDEIWQNPEILSRVQNLAQNEIFDHSEPAKDEIGQNQEILSRIENLSKTDIFDHSGHAKEEIW